MDAYFALRGFRTLAIRIKESKRVAKQINSELRDQLKLGKFNKESNVIILEYPSEVMKNLKFSCI